MGLGLFGTPIYLNIKCLVFSAFVIAVWFLPHPKFWQHSIVVGFLLASLAYVLLAWYDFIFDCNDQLRPTFLGWLSAPFKPAEYEENYNKLPIKWQKIVRWVDIVALAFAILFVSAPFFIYSK